MHSLQEQQFRVEHQHNDGSWSELAEDHSHHGAPAHDPERGWVQRVFRCQSCSEVVRLGPTDQPPAPDAE